MVAGMNRVVNQGLTANHHERVFVDADVEILQSWGAG